ncbi:conserved hypothetical protein [Neospora caninum Liverpool]|uniref:PPR repeat-containing protein n=1 Tax=Neospora caninum (strain Liverpool) TaxID=572307 RepID=F0VED2_NEOCL|nr:conserved hypothetical protein [Neospora caninum Liverpool]CBZ52076.1 conserved hypothetical protein [Neospora caninum Liverpool]|eukprot:XP_003882108.1 conserved hypothetical protein [Neospora caninum Liverpool]
MAKVQDIDWKARAGPSAESTQRPLRSAPRDGAPEGEISGDDPETQRRLSPLRIDYRKAFELLEQADPTGIKALTAAYNAALHACERQRDRPGALRIYAAMREKQIPVDVVTLHSLFTLLEAFGDDTALLQILAQVDASDPDSSLAFLAPSPSSSPLSPSLSSPSGSGPGLAAVSVTPSLLTLGISTCCRAGNATAAVQLMERLKALLRRNAEHFLLSFTSVLPPDTADATAAVAHPPTSVYVQLVVALSQDGRYEEALAYYEELKSLQRRFIQQQHILQREAARRAELVEREATTKNLSEDERKELLSQIEKQVVEEQEHLLEDYQPPISAINAALEACCCTGRLKQALAIYKEDVEFSQQQRVLAGEALDQAEPTPNKSSPTVRTFDLLLRACSQQRQAFALAQIWRDFERHRERQAETPSERLFRLPAAASCFASAIQGFAVCGDWTYALSLLLLLHREMSTARQRLGEHLSRRFQEGRGGDAAGQQAAEASDAREASGLEESTYQESGGDVGIEPYLAVLRACRDVGAWKPALGVLRLLQQRRHQERLLHALGTERERREAERRDRFQQQVLALRGRLAEAKKTASGVGNKEAPRQRDHAQAPPGSDPLLSRDMERVLGCLDGPTAVGRVPLLPEFPFEAYALCLGACATAGAWEQVLAVSAEFFSPRNSAACAGRTAGMGGAREESESKLANRGGCLADSESGETRAGAGSEREGPQASLEIRKIVNAYRLMALVRLGRHQLVEEERRSLIRLMEMERRTRERRHARERDREGHEEERGREEASLAKWREEADEERLDQRGDEDNQDTHGIASRALAEAESWLKTEAVRARPVRGSDERWQVSLTDDAPGSSDATYPHSLLSSSSSTSSSSFSASLASPLSAPSPSSVSFVGKAEPAEVHSARAQAAEARGARPLSPLRPSVSAVSDRGPGEASEGGSDGDARLAPRRRGLVGRGLDSFFAGLEPASEREARAEAEAAARRREHEREMRETTERRSQETGGREGDDGEGIECHQASGWGTRGDGEIRKSEEGRVRGSEGEKDAGRDATEREKDREHTEREGDENSEGEGGAVGAVAGDSGAPVAAFLSSVLGPRRVVLESIREEPLLVDQTPGERADRVHADAGTPEAQERPGEEEQTDAVGEGGKVDTERGNATRVVGDIEEERREKQEAREGDFPRAMVEGWMTSKDRGRAEDSGGNAECLLDTGRFANGKQEGVSPACETSSSGRPVETSLDLLLRHKQASLPESANVSVGPPRWLATQGAAAATGPRLSAVHSGVRTPEGWPGVLPRGEETQGARASSAPHPQPAAQPAKNGFLFAGNHGWGWPPHWEEKLDKARDRWQRESAGRHGEAEREESAETESPWGMRPSP